MISYDRAVATATKSDDVAVAAMEAFKSEIATLKVEREQMATMRKSLELTSPSRKSRSGGGYDPSGFDGPQKEKTLHVLERAHLSATKEQVQHQSVEATVAAARQELKADDLLIATLKISRGDADVQYDPRKFDDSTTKYGSSKNDRFLDSSPEMKLLERDFHEKFLGVKDGNDGANDGVSKEEIRAEVRSRALLASSADRADRNNEDSARKARNRGERGEVMAEEYKTHTDKGSHTQSSRLKSTSTSRKSKVSSPGKASTVRINSTKTVQRRMELIKKKQKGEEEEENVSFKARDAPWSSKVKMFDIIQQKDQEARAQRIQHRSEKLLTTATLPPRMQEYDGTIGTIDKIKKEQAKKIRDRSFLSALTSLLFFFTFFEVRRKSA